MSEVLEAHNIFQIYVGFPMNNFAKYLLSTKDYESYQNTIRK